jgi:hypothetical protein
LRRNATCDDVTKHRQPRAPEPPPSLACPVQSLIAGAAGSAYAADYTPVTDARLANPEPGNWLMTRGGYKGWSYRRAEHIGQEDR